jgi:hypothetical protein
MAAAPFVPQRLCLGPQESLCENSVLMSFRGAAGDEESRSALENIQSEILRCAQDDSEGLGMTT